MIIRDGDPGSGDTTTFRLVSADGGVEIPLRLAAVLADDFRTHLAARGFRIGEGRARGVLAEVVVATAANAAAWTAAGGTVVAFLRRHRGKTHRFEIDGKSFSMKGYSARSVWPHNFSNCSANAGNRIGTGNGAAAASSGPGGDRGDST